MLGSLGSIVFIASEKTLRTFKDFRRSGGGRYTAHEVLGQKPLTQWIGPGLDTVNFVMRFDAKFGVNPRKEMDNIVALERAGKALTLTIGGKGVGTALWIITGYEQTWSTVDNLGNVLTAEVSISLQEYIHVVKR